MKQETVTRDDINRALKKIFMRIGHEDSSKLHAELDEIYEYKPVDNYYTYVKASLYLYEKSFEKLRNILAGKENWYFPGQYAPYLAQLQYECSKARSAPYGAKKQKILSYYTYLAAAETQNLYRKVFADEEFIKNARDCYEAELMKKNELLKEFINDSASDELIINHSKALFEVTYNLSQDLQCIIMLALKESIIVEKERAYDLFKERVAISEPNVGYLRQELKSSKGLFVLIADGQNSLNEYKVLAHGIQLLRQEVILIEEDCLSQMEHLLDFHRIINLITSRNMFIKLKQVQIFQNKIQCLSEFRGDMFNDEICFGYCGSYEAYLSKMYQYDYLENITSEDKYLFSVIIPARNSAYTLQYTIQTVLNQRNATEDEFEVIISDNSEGGNYEVKKLIEALADKRVKYYKTPAELPLHRSFEFAYGIAKGKYIIPLGSDDGLLPWTLETLKTMSEKYSEENIIGWQRAFFQWSKTRSDQRGKLVIPDIYIKGNYREKLYGGLETLKGQIEQNGSSSYGIPLLYINTAFKRRYLKELLDITGVIMDGFTQDISMGIRSMLANKEFLFLEYPLSIAGLSDNSLGARMQSEVKSDAELEHKLSVETVRGLGYTVISTEYPFLVIPSTEGLFWAEMFKAIEIPELRKSIFMLMQDHDFKQTLIQLTGCRSKNDLDYMLYLNKLRYNAYWIDTELGIWFDSILYPAATEKVYKTDNNTSTAPNPSDTIGYKTGYINGRGLTLDARKFGVNNIKEAAELLENILCL